jgi:hypothetical protein
MMVNRKDVEIIKKAFEDLKNADEKTRLEFDVSTGLRTPDGRIAERYRHLFKEKE